MSVALDINDKIGSGSFIPLGQETHSTDIKATSLALPLLLELGALLAIDYLILGVVGPNFTLLLCSGYLVISIAHLVYVVAAETLCGVRYQEDPFVADRQGAVFSAVHTLMHAGIGTAIHEAGHAFSAWLLFNKASPQITILPFRGGSTSYAISYGLTSVGELFGKETSLGIIKAAGMAFSTLTATVTLVFAGNIKEAYPCLSEGLQCAATSLLLNEVVNGLSTLVVEKTALYLGALAVAGVALLVLARYVKEAHPKIAQGMETAVKVVALNELIIRCWNFTAPNTRLSNDFVNLWVRYGIHPFIPLGLIVALPLLALGVTQD
jgi:hypothetical protein